MKLDEKEKEHLQLFKKESEEKILASNMFCSLMTPGADLSPEVLLQMGIAILHDKPIIVIAFEGAKISENLKKIAIGIEYIKNESEMESAYKRLMEKIDFRGNRPPY